MIPFVPQEPRPEIIDLLKEVEEGPERKNNFIWRIELTHYLIEIPFQGQAKEDVKQLISKIDRKFNLGYFRKHKKIPHISLVGPFTTNSEERLIRDFKNICEHQLFSSYKLKGFGFFKDNRVIFINTKSNVKLDDFRWKLSQSLQPYCSLRPFDYEENFDFHATLALDLDSEKYTQIKNYVTTLNEPELKQFVMRVRLLKNSRILREYDFLQRRTLNREQALNEEILYKTFQLLRIFFDGSYDPDKGLPK
jgi:hypothetical protein